jgi:hypothetical protein
MATYTLSNTAAQIDQAISRAFARIGNTANNVTNFGRNNTASGLNASSLGNNSTASGVYSAAYGNTNTTSGNYSAAFGSSNITSGASSLAFGTGNTAGGGNSSAFGRLNFANGASSSAFGRSNSANGSNSSAFGAFNTASANYSSAFGFAVRTSVANVQEFGRFTAAGVRQASIRFHSDGTFSLPARNAIPINGNPSVSITSLTQTGGLATATTSGNHLLLNGQQINISGATPADYNGGKFVTVTGATTFTFTIGSETSSPATGTITGITADGSERDGSIPINNFTIRRNGLQFFLTYNDAGTIRNVSLGTVA